MLRWFVIPLWLCACNQIFHIPDVTQGNVDECSDGLAKCSPDATCTDTPDSYTCACNQGFDGDGMTCTDVDECATSPCGAHGTCANTPGSYTCTCDSGFTGDGTYCVPASWQKLVAAGNFTCGLSAQGEVYCWGQNWLGALGDGTYLPHARPVQVGTATDWIDVDARLLKACGLRSDHSAWCWGYGDNGTLGDGLLMSSPSPVQVVSDKPGVGWKQIAVGKFEVCAIHDDGSLACWGLDRVTNIKHGTAVAVDANTDWTAIAAGSVKCGLRSTSGGNLYCWGKGTYGDLGLGATVSQTTPALVGTNTYRSLSLGYQNGCAIKDDGTLWCWGNNVQIATAMQYGTAPTEVDTHTDWQQISVSIDTIAGVRAGGNAFMWGNNQQGQAGLPTLGTFMYPTQLAGSVTGWSAVRAGNSHSCGLANGNGYCWGAIGEGTLGNGVTVTYYVPTRIGTETYSTVSSGPIKCALTTAGALECWGFSSVAGVGFGNIDPVWPPTRLGTETWSSVSSLYGTVGVPVTCGVRGGNLLCFGDNTTGELGIGNTATPQLSPVMTAGSVSGWAQVSATDHTCAITTAGALYCWGADDQGQLGDGMTSPTPTTAPAAAITGQWLQVVTSPPSVSGPMTCAIRGDRSLWCWGQYDFPGATDVNVPTQIGADTDWAQLSTIGPQTCGVKTSGQLWCWGALLGDGTMNSSSTPTRVGTDSDWKSVAVGNEICGIKTGGTLWCFADQFGEPLGNGYAMHDPITLQVNPTLAPVQIGTDSDWAQVSTGGDSCAVKTDGSLWCWGYTAAAVPQFVSVPTPID